MGSCLSSPITHRSLAIVWRLFCILKNSATVELEHLHPEFDAPASREGTAARVQVICCRIPCILKLSPSVKLAQSQRSQSPSVKLAQLQLEFGAVGS